MPLHKPEKATIRYPAELKPLIKKRMAEEHYRSESAYFNGLLLFDLTARCKHWLTAQIVNEPPEILDKVVAEIVRDFNHLPRRDGGWFRGRVKELIAERENELRLEVQSG